MLATTPKDFTGKVNIDEQLVNGRDVVPELVNVSVILVVNTDNDSTCHGSNSNVR